MIFPILQLSLSQVPKQSNWTDCGLYLLQYTELFSENESFILNDTEVIYSFYFSLTPKF